jgi:hypothetical protein
MSEIKRWYCESRCGWMENVDDSSEISDSTEFVAAEDYDALLKEFDALKQKPQPLSRGRA